MIHRRTGEKRYAQMAMLSVLLLLILIPATGSCHSLYIQSSRYLLSEGKRSPLFFCYGHHIPVDDGVRAKKLKSIRVYPPDGTVREVGIRNETGLHSYMVDATYNGYSTESEDNAYPKKDVSGDTLRISIPLPGRWFVRYYIKTDAQVAGHAQYNQMKHTATLVFQIPNKPKNTDSNTH